MVSSSFSVAIFPTRAWSSSISAMIPCTPLSLSSFWQMPFSAPSPGRIVTLLCGPGGT